MLPGDQAGAAQGPPLPVTIAVVTQEQWQVVRWLWQAFRQDLAVTVDGYPYPDGRYQAAVLDEYPSPAGAGYLAWRPHPKTGDAAPVAFAVVGGLLAERRSIVGFWVAPAARRDGIGRQLALDVLSRHPGPWTIGFQQENARAGAFWRAMADAALGVGRWTEAARPVPDRPDVPPDHLIESW